MNADSETNKYPRSSGAPVGMTPPKSSVCNTAPAFPSRAGICLVADVCTLYSLLVAIQGDVRNAVVMVAAAVIDVLPMQVAIADLIIRGGASAVREPQ